GKKVGAQRAVVVSAAVLVAGAASWVLLGSDDRAPARSALDVGGATSAPVPQERPSTVAPEHAASAHAPEPRVRVAEIAARGAQLPEAAARDTLRALARDAVDRVERGAAISALW